MADTVVMVRSETGETADVHPAEVETWRTHGWQVIEPAEPEPTSTKSDVVELPRRRKD